jgi:nitronate monooxygenase
LGSFVAETPRHASLIELQDIALEIEQRGKRHTSRVLALQSPAAVHTALTNRFTGRPARSIVNRVMRELGPMGEVSPFPLAGAALAPLRAAAEASGSSDFSSLWAGQNTTGCRQIGAAEMTRELASNLR